MSQLYKTAQSRVESKPTHHEGWRESVANLIDRHSRFVHHEAEHGTEKSIQNSPVERSVDPDPRPDQDVDQLHVVPVDVLSRFRNLREDKIHPVTKLWGLVMIKPC